MAATPLETVGRQLGSAAGTQVRATQAQVARETSIVRLANARLGAALNGAGNAARSKTAKQGRKSGVYVQERLARTAPDGYVRLSPVQEIQTAPGYRKRCVKRVIGAVIGLAIAAGVLALLVQYLF